MVVSAESSLSQALKVSAEKAVGLSTTCCPLRLTATTQECFQTLIARTNTFWNLRQIYFEIWDKYIANDVLPIAIDCHHSRVLSSIACKMYLSQIPKCICLKLRLTSTTQKCFQTLLARLKVVSMNTIPRLQNVNFKYRANTKTSFYPPKKIPQISAFDHFLHGDTLDFHDILKILTVLNIYLPYKILEKCHHDHHCGNGHHGIRVSGRLGWRPGDHKTNRMRHWYSKKIGNRTFFTWICPLVPRLDNCHRGHHEIRVSGRLGRQPGDHKTNRMRHLKGGGGGIQDHRR